MKELVKNSRVCGYLERIYRQLNKDYFNNELEEPVITIQSTPRAYGHVTCAKVWQVKDTARYELNLGAGTLDRPIEETVATMLHEMVHIYHLMHDIQDCSRGGTYHNKKFKTKAESVGLVIEHDPRIGFSITSPSDDLILYICNQGWTDVLMNREEQLRIPVSGIGGKSAGGTVAPKKPSSTRKYCCPCCDTSVRATKNVNIICGRCMQTMVLQD